MFVYGAAHVMPAGVKDATSSMAGTVEMFEDLLPASVVQADDYRRILRTLQMLPPIFAGNGFGIEHEIRDDGTAKESSLSVSLALQYEELGRVNLARLVQRYLGDWMLDEAFHAWFLDSAERLAAEPLFPIRTYFGFEVPDVSRSELRVAGIVWAFEEGHPEASFDAAMRLLLGARYAPEHPSLVTLRGVCGDARVREVGYGRRGEREVHKAYLHRPLAENVALLEHFPIGAAEALRDNLMALAEVTPEWSCLCALDALEGVFARVGFELNFEHEESRRFVEPFLASPLVAHHFPERALEPIRSTLLEGVVLRDRDGRVGRFEVTHAKVSLRLDGSINWKVYFAFEVQNEVPESLPILLPWLRGTA
ncbi:MAG: hypothetical protein RMA76_09750 [Deltaproteobacteria bacterium]|jgi:hypothetical protein